MTEFLIFVYSEVTTQYQVLYGLRYHGYAILLNVSFPMLHFNFHMKHGLHLYSDRIFLFHLLIKISFNISFW